MTKDYKLEILFAGVFFCVYIFLAIFNASEYFAYFSIVFGMFGLIFAWKLFENIDDQPEGGDKMMAIAETIHDGAMVFLSRKYRISFYFACGLMVVLLVVVGFFQGIWIGICTTIAFAMGAISSLLAGFFAANAIASASERMAQAAHEGDRARASDIAINGGSVVGACIVSLGLAGVGLLFLIFARGDSVFVINGYALGASAMTLIVRISGGLFSNAVDINYDPAGRQQADFKDTADNFGAVAPCIGKNLRSVGLSADFFESYVGVIISAIALGATSADIPQALRFDYMALPLLVCMAGLIVTMAGIRAVPFYEQAGSALVFRYSAPISAGAMSIASLFAIKVMGLSSALFIALLFGCLAGLAGACFNEFNAKYSHSPNIGVSARLMDWSTAAALIPIVVIAVTVFCAVKSAGLYGVALAGVGLMGTTGINLSIKASGFLTENAGRIAYIAGLESSKIIDDIKAFDQTKPATHRGFMITASAITALALFGAYLESAHIKEIEIANAGVLVGFFLGAIISFLTPLLAMKSLGRLTSSLQNETGAEPGKSDTVCHIDHAARAAIKETLSPGLVVFAIPVLVSLAFGKQALAALLLGCILMGVGLSLFLANDGIWIRSPGSAELADKTFDPLKDTCLPALNAVIKAVAIVSLILSAMFA